MTPSLPSHTATFLLLAHNPKVLLSQRSKSHCSTLQLHSVQLKNTEHIKVTTNPKGERETFAKRRHLSQLQSAAAPLQDLKSVKWTDQSFPCSFDNGAYNRLWLVLWVVDNQRSRLVIVGWAVEHPCYCSDVNDTRGLFPFNGFWGSFRQRSLCVCCV